MACDTIKIETLDADEVVSIVTAGPQGPSGAEAATLTTQGDTLYRGPTAPQRLGIGTPGQVLKVNSGATAPEWANESGAVTQVNGQTGTVTLTASDVGAAPASGISPSAISGTAVVDSDPRLTDARTPSSTLAHKTSHAIGGSDALSPADIGAAAASHTHPSTAISDSTTAGRALLTAADAAAQRTSLGLAAIATSGSASDLTTGTVATARLGTGTANSSTFLRGDGAWTTTPETLVIACSDETTNLTTGTAKVTFRMPYAMTLTAVRASVNTAPTGSTLIVDINEGANSILSTKLSIDASEKTSTTAASAAVISDSALADDAEMTIDIDQIGSTVAGKGLKVALIGTRS